MHHLCTITCTLTLFVYILREEKTSEMPDTRLCPVTLTCVIKMHPQGARTVLLCICWCGLDEKCAHNSFLRFLVKRVWFVGSFDTTSQFAWGGSKSVLVGLLPVIVVTVKSVNQVIFGLLSEYLKKASPACPLFATGKLSVLRREGRVSNVEWRRTGCQWLAKTVNGR